MICIACRHWQKQVQRQRQINVKLHKKVFDVQTKNYTTNCLYQNNKLLSPNRLSNCYGSILAILNILPYIYLIYSIYRK